MYTMQQSRPMQNTNSMWVPSGNFQPRRYSSGRADSWAGHLPFARDLIAETRPQLLVELGTDDGESYFGFCQAISENGIACVSYAVGPDPEHFEDVRDYNQIHYASFSRLLPLALDDALAQFSDGTINILHLREPHSYDRASHVFRSWLPKVRPGGFVLFSNAVARHSDFGLWKIWDETEGYGRRFLFPHNGGLGVLEKAGGQQVEPGFRNAVFEGNERQQEHIRRFYRLCADSLELQSTAERANAADAREKAAQQELARMRRDLLDGQRRSAELLEKHDAALIEKESALSELHKARTKALVLETQVRELKRELERSRTELIERQIVLDTLKNNQRDLQHRYNDLQHGYNDLQHRYELLSDQLNGVLQSHSWKLTAPLRFVTEKLRK